MISKPLTTLVRVLAYLAVGAVFAITLAWLRGIAKDAPVAYSRKLDLASDLAWLGASMPDAIGAALRRDDVDFAWRSDGRRSMLTRFGEETVEYTFWRYGPDGKPDKVPEGTGRVTRVSRGWPMVCVEGSLWTAGVAPVTANESLLVIHGVSALYVFPYRILPLGLIVDAAFWGGFVFLMRLLPPFAERGLRRRRGLCPACAYPLQGRTRCPECGAEPNARSTSC